MTTQAFKMTRGMYIGTAILKFLLRVGVPMGTLKLLAHQGRKSGRLYSTPVALVRRKQERWLVAAFGDVNWVKNVRQAGKVQFQGGLHKHEFDIVELDPIESAPILKQFLNDYRVVPFFQPYFSVDRDAPLSEFQEEAKKHPVFLIIE